jgi:hypothetical protein
MRAWGLKALAAVALLMVADCATGGVRTLEQARTIALSSPCANPTPVLAPNEQKPTEWLAERRGERWYAWLPYGPGAQLRGGNGQFPAHFGHMGAWIDPKDGKILSCERGGAE